MIDGVVDADMTAGMDLVIGGTDIIGVGVTANIQAFRGTPFDSVLWVDPTAAWDFGEMFCHSAWWWMQLPAIWWGIEIRWNECILDILDIFDTGFAIGCGLVSYELDDVMFWGGDIMYDKWWDTCEEKDFFPYFPFLDGERSDYDGNELMGADALETVEEFELEF